MLIVNFRGFTIKIFLRILAIVYLLWALFYSAVFAPAWIAEAMAFKLNGGPQLVAQLNGAGFFLYAAQIDVDNQALRLSLWAGY